MAVRIKYNQPYCDGNRLDQCRRLIRQVRQYREQHPVHVSDLLLAVVCGDPRHIVEIASRLRESKPLTEVVL